MITETPESKPTPPVHRRPSIKSLSSEAEIKKEIAASKAQRDREAARIAQLESKLEYNAKQQKSERGLRDVIPNVLDKLDPKNVATILTLIAPFVGDQGKMDDVRTWQEMHAQRATAALA